jgi:hypothetical protein
MECAEGCNCEYVFAHCANCLKNDAPSSYMKVIIFDDHTELYCSNCGKPVSSSIGKFHFKDLHEAEHPKNTLQ